jgi:hypothetical protein
MRIKSATPHWHCSLVSASVQASGEPHPMLLAAAWLSTLLCSSLARLVLPLAEDRIGYFIDPCSPEDHC